MGILYNWVKVIFFCASGVSPDALSMICATVMDYLSGGAGFPIHKIIEYYKILNWQNVVYSFLFEPQNIEQGIANYEVLILHNSAVPCSTVRYSRKLMKNGFLMDNIHHKLLIIYHN